MSDDTKRSDLDELYGAEPGRVSDAAVPVYFSVGNVTGDYTFSLKRSNPAVHFHVTLYAPVDTRPVKRALYEIFGGFRRCDAVMFYGVDVRNGEAGVLHAEIDVPLVSHKVLEDFTKRLILYVVHCHFGETARRPRSGMAPLGARL